MEPATWHDYETRSHGKEQRRKRSRINKTVVKSTVRRSGKKRRRESDGNVSVPKIKKEIDNSVSSLPKTETELGKSTSKIPLSPKSLKELRIGVRRYQYKCRYCWVSTKSKATLDIHLQLHLQDSPSLVRYGMFRFRCEKCPSYGVLRRSHLERHLRHHRLLEANKWGCMKIESNRELFYCSFCNYYTCKIFNLVKHVPNCKGYKAGKKPVLKFKMSTTTTQFDQTEEENQWKEGKPCTSSEQAASDKEERPSTSSKREEKSHRADTQKTSGNTRSKKKVIGSSFSKKLVARSRRMITQKALVVREDRKNTTEEKEVVKDVGEVTVSTASIEQLIENFTVQGTTKRHRCKICGYESNNVGHVVRHMVVHRKDAKKWPFKCTKCSARFSIKGNLAIHAKVHYGEHGSYNCLQCCKVYQSRVGLYKHNRKYHREEMEAVKKEQASKKSRQRRGPYKMERKKRKKQKQPQQQQPEVKQEVMDVYEPTPVQEVPLNLQTHKCPQCDFIAQTMILLKIHMRDLHSPQKSLRCNLCSYATTEKSNLMRHMKMLHSDTDSFNCSLCPFTTTTKNQLVVHMNQHSVGSLYICEECHFVTNSSEELQEHASTHIKEKPYNCPGCPYSTSWKPDFEVHLDAHGANDVYRCHYCDYAVSTARSLDIHLRLHVKLEPLRCSLCEYTTNNKATFEWHIRCHTDESLFKCQFCESRFQKSGSLLLHMKMHAECTPAENGEALTADNNNIIPFDNAAYATNNNEMKKCDYCDFETVQPLVLAQHLRNEHSEVMPFKCNLCGFSASKLINYYQHMRRFHTDHGTQYKCPYCEFTGVQKSDLVVHMRKHSGQRPFKCDFCSYVTTRKSLLTQHMRQHTGEKPYKCDIDGCSFSTATYNNLVRHKRCHTGERPYHCEQCEFTTGQRSHLMRHMRIHTGDKPYMCSLCGYESAYASEIKRHNARHSNVKALKCPYCCYSTNKKHAFQNHTNKYHPDIDSEVETGEESQVLPVENSPQPLEHFISPYELPSTNNDMPVLELQHPTLDYTNDYVHPQHVCEYCDRRFDSQEEWDKHVKRHFMQWPQPQNPEELLANVQASSGSSNIMEIHQSE